jgi:hypothetical protein
VAGPGSPLRWGGPPLIRDDDLRPGQAPVGRRQEHRGAGPPRCRPWRDTTKPWPSYARCSPAAAVRIRPYERAHGFPKIEVPERWNGCLLVNPLCPDDLCWLPAENGRQHRWHCLGTDRGVTGSPRRHRSV